MKTFNFFSKFSPLKSNISKCEVAGIGSMKVIKIAIYGITCIELTTETIKILGKSKITNTKKFGEKHH